MTLWRRFWRWPRCRCSGFRSRRAWLRRSRSRTRAEGRRPPPPAEEQANRSRRFARDGVPFAIRRGFRENPPMHVTAKADYAIRAVVELSGSSQESPRKVDDLAQAQKIPVSFLENI